MKVLISAFTGFNYRELLLPLSPLLNRDHEIDHVIVITPGAARHGELFPDLTAKYTFIPEAKSATGYEEILRAHQPTICVTPTAGLEPRDIPLIEAAKRLGIPTLTFVASWDNVYKMERIMTMGKYKKRYALASYFALWNNINRAHLLRIVPELDPERATVTGPPRLDYLQRNDLPSRAELAATLGVSSDAKLIHIATTELYSSDYILQALARERGKSLPDNMQLLVSVHPGGNYTRHHGYAAPHGAKVFYSFGRRDSSPAPDFIYAPTLSDMRLHAALFKHADLLINHSSTVTIESIVADRPVITVKYGRPFDWFTWRRSMVYRDFQQHAKTIIESGATAVVKNRHQLIAATHDYLKNPELHRVERRALKETMVPGAGNAGVRLLDLIKKIAKVKPSP